MLVIGKALLLALPLPLLIELGALISGLLQLCLRLFYVPFLHLKLQLLSGKASLDFRQVLILLWLAGARTVHSLLVMLLPKTCK